MDPIITAKLRLSSTLREPGDGEILSAGELLGQLDAEARALGQTPTAAPVHYAMGRVYIERLGDPRGAATCYQNAFLLDPRYRPNIEAARRLFVSEGAWERALALHRHEESLLHDPAAKTESLRAQAWILGNALERREESAALVQRALVLSPEHPALLKDAVTAAMSAGDPLGAARLLLRSASVLKDDVQRGVLLRRAVLLFEELHAEAVAAQARPSGPPPPAGDGPLSATPGELASLLEEATRRLHAADPDDPIGTTGLLLRARATGAWDEALRLSRQQADRGGGPAARLLVAQIALHKLGRPAEALAELQAGLAEAPLDPGLHAMHTELVAVHKPQELLAALNLRAGAAADASERADCKIVAAALAETPLEREHLLSEALAENPGDAAAIALHARLVAQRDAGAAAERFTALGEALEAHVPADAALHFLEAAAWLERAGRRAEAGELGLRVLTLAEHHPAALRLLQRTLPFVGGAMQLSRVLEDAAAASSPARGAELLGRAAALLSDLPSPAEVEQEPGDGASEAEGDEDGAGDGDGSDESRSEDAAASDESTQLHEVPPHQRALDLAQRAAELARGLNGPRWTEAWTTLALRLGDLPALSRALELRAELLHGTEGSELLVEAAELSRASSDETRAAALLRRARQMDLACTPARQLLLALPNLPVMERLDLLAEEARAADPARAAALQAERSALFEQEGRIDDAVQACAQSLSLGGVDLAVLRRLMRLQLRRGDLSAALAVLLQLASALPEGAGRAEACSRAAELCEWRLLDPRRALELHEQAAVAFPSPLPFAAIGRLHLWEGNPVDAAAAFEQQAAVAKKREKVAALRRAASLRAHRTSGPGKAAELYRELLLEEPGDLPAMAALLQVTLGDFGAEGRRERAELRGKLASYCQDPRMAALLRAESAEDRLAGGERDQGVAEYRRALALNPYDRVALDTVEEALRASGERQLLAEHLAFRCAYEDAETKAALALQQAEIFAEDENLEKAAAAYRQALANDPGSLLATRGARKIAERSGDKQEVMRLLAKEAGLAHDPGLAAGSLVEAALLAEDLGNPEEAIQHLTVVLERDPGNEEVAKKLRRVLGENAPAQLVTIFEHIGDGHAEPKAGATAWIAAGHLQLDDLQDPQAAFVAAGKAQALDPDSHAALELRADAADAAGRWVEAADALARRMALPADEVRRSAWRLRLGMLYVDKLGDPERALPLLADRLDALPLTALIRLAPAARSLPAPESVRLHRKLLEAFPEPAASGTPGKAQIAEWTDELARGALAMGDRSEALAAFKRAWQLEPRNRGALEHVAQLSADEAPEEAASAYRTLFDLSSPRPEVLRALAAVFLKLGNPDASFCAGAALVGLGAATAAEKAAHDELSARPPPAELPLLADSQALIGDGDAGLAREFLAAATPELSVALRTEMAGRGDRVKGDNPVRRICSAIGRALGLSQEPALFLARSEPFVVLAAVTDPPGLLVGADVPRRYTPRQQRFLYARALAHLRRGTHMVVGLPPRRLLQMIAELSRVCTPPGTDNDKLPPPDEQLAEMLSSALSPEARHRLSPLALRIAREGVGSTDSLALGMRESAERTALAICGDPAAALTIVGQECPGGLERPEVARLARFAVSDAFFAIRAR